MERSADVAAGLPVSITIDGTAYSVSPLKAKDWGALTKRMRDQAIDAIWSSGKIDPIAKRDIVSKTASATFGMEALLNELMTPDTSAWILERQIRVNHPDFDASLLEKVDMLAIMELLVSISGVSGKAKGAEVAPSGSSTGDN